MTVPPLFCAFHTPHCKGEGKVKSQNFLKIRTFNFAINDFYSYKVAKTLYHKRYFDVRRAENEAIEHGIIPVRVAFGVDNLDYIKSGIKLKSLIDILPERVYYKHMNTIAAFIKQKRKEAGLTQAEFAMRSGLGLRFVRDLEQGKETVRMDKVNQALAMFGMKAVPGRMDE
jgi:y4mF family transcriptional regulator